jgi:hypothetical protein
MKQVNILGLALICLLFLSSFGFVEYSVIQPKFNSIITDSTKTNQNSNDLLGSKSFSQDQPNNQKQENDESSEKTLVSWTEYFALAIKAVFLKLISFIISIFI